MPLSVFQPHTVFLDLTHLLRFIAALRWHFLVNNVFIDHNRDLTISFKLVFCVYRQTFCIYDTVISEKPFISSFSILSCYPINGTRTTFFVMVVIAFYFVNPLIQEYQRLKNDLVVLGGTAKSIDTYTVDRSVSF